MTTVEAVLGAPSSTLRVRRRRAPEGRFLAVALVLVVLLQRFAISPGGNEVPVIVPILLVLVAVGLYRGRLRVHRLNASLIVLLVLTALIATLAQMSQGDLPSVLSVASMTLIYIPAMVRSTGGAATLRVVADVFVVLMTIAALVSLVQFVGQYAGIANVDWFTRLVPAQFLVQGYSPNAPVHYGQSLLRSNAFVFLEPSFLSLSLGMAVLVAVRTGRGWFQLTILLAGMVPTLAGNGIAVLIPGLVITLFSPVRRNLLALLPGLIAAIVVATVSPLGRLYLGRSTEANSSGSSSSLRFVQPYTTLLPASLDSPFHTLFGHGASTSDPFLDNQGLIAVTRPIVPKVLFEYGMLGAVGIVLVLLVLFVGGLRHNVWMLGLLPTYFVINASFLQAEIAAFTIFWLCLIPRGADLDTFSTPRWRRKQLVSEKRRLSTERRILGREASV
ncbi:hypothetical protein GCM10025780_18940 [Frondihabitans cladoniiphilus]|uniref:Uncharacterized protein n=1 Tax=Frondihabitans cladoniiphilus TaxID=715785 RepID=A0ABP8VYV4_9MICO